MRMSGAVRTLLFLVFAGCLTSSASASVILTLLYNPPTTAGGGATSTRSGNNSWQLYAIESADATDFGISSYNIVMSGTTAINHRSPVTTINDGNDDPQTAGFSLLRTATNVNPIQASQALPGQTPFPITGFGQTASSFPIKATAIDPLAVVGGPTTSGSWGNYNSPILNSLASSTGHKWLFIAEGLGPAFATSVTSASFTVYSNSSGTASVATPSQFVIYIDDPEPASFVLLLAGSMLASFSVRRRPRHRRFPTA